MKYAAALFVLLAAVPASAQPSNLVATGRTDTSLYMNWQAGGYTHFTLDYLGPEWFGGAEPTCNDFPMHPNQLIVEGDAQVITGLQPSTWYHIHVHAVDPVFPHNVLEGVDSTNVIIVKTRADATFESLTLGSSPDYIDCAGGGGGGDDGCAQVTFTLLPGSEPLEQVQVTLVDPPTGNELDTFMADIGQPQEAPEGSFHLRFSAPPGYEVTPVQRGLNLKCGDDTAVRLRFRSEPPRNH